MSRGALSRCPSVDGKSVQGPTPALPRFANYNRGMKQRWCPSRLYELEPLIALGIGLVSMLEWSRQRLGADGQ
jgi:hypothetical protein